MYVSLLLKRLLLNISPLPLQITPFLSLLSSVSWEADQYELHQWSSCLWLPYGFNHRGTSKRLEDASREFGWVCIPLALFLLHHRLSVFLYRRPCLMSRNTYNYSFSLQVPAMSSSTSFSALVVVTFPTAAGKDVVHHPLLVSLAQGISFGIVSSSTPPSHSICPCYLFQTLIGTNLNMPFHYPLK